MIKVFVVLNSGYISFCLFWGEIVRLCYIYVILLNVKGFLNELYVFILCNLIWWKRIIILSVYILIMVCEDVFINEFDNLSNFL